ncbi:hypothetical protein NLI96_g12727 [Meripilus lineatus]|uniref:Uncharacterized protein n=1 Tax=Meripilus lineatus TaxID=2056292 RepID=A0AAD5YC47_9APHY|nr:hypothetical protein NLI96_g12727 [Physisporinus lineatus]
MNERAAADTVQFAQRQVNAAAEKAKDAAAALAAFRNSHTVFDPDRQSALQLQQVPVLKASIDTLQKQIKVATGGVTGGQDSLSQKATGYARLQLDSQFADKQLASAMAALENARSEAERKQLYLERLVEPNRPDIAIEPKRIRGILTAFIVGLVVWGALSLLLASVREHRD